MIERVLGESGVRALHVADLSTARSCLARPDWASVLLDVALPDAEPNKLIEVSKRLHPGRPVLAIAAVASPGSVVDTLRAGADGFILHSEIEARLVVALLDVAAGGAFLSPAAGRALLQEVRGRARAQGRPQLTPRQVQVLDLLATGAGYAEIGRELRIALNTVRTHVTGLYELLGVENRAEAVNLGWRLGLLDPAGHRDGAAGV